MLGTRQHAHAALWLCVFFASAAAVPLQYEEIRPAGPGPKPRHSHSFVTLNSMEGMPILFGGADESGTLGDVWQYDAPANAWQELSFPARDYKSLIPTNISADMLTYMCKIERLNSAEPGKRAGHNIAALGACALMCGGYSAASATSYSLAGAPCSSGCLLDCWWLRHYNFHGGTSCYMREKKRVQIVKAKDLCVAGGLEWHRGSRVPTVTCLVSSMEAWATLESFWQTAGTYKCQKQ